MTRRSKVFGSVLFFSVLPIQQACAQRAQKTQKMQKLKSSEAELLERDFAVLQKAWTTEHSRTDSAAGASERAFIKRWARAFPPWQRELLAAEIKPRAELIRAVYYPRALLRLARYRRTLAYAQEREEHADEPRVRAALLQLRCLAELGLGHDIDAKKRAFEAQQRPGLAAWAAGILLAMDVREGWHEEAKHALERTLAQFSAKAKNVPVSEELRRQDMAVVVTLLGKRAAPLAVDRWLTEKGVAAKRGKQELDEREAAKQPGLQASHGKVRLLAFMRPGSGASIEVAAQLAALQARFPKKLQVFAVCQAADESALERIASFRRKRHLAIPFALTKDGSCARAFGMRRLPGFVVLGPKGLIRYLSLGSAELALLELVVEGLVQNR